MIFLRDSNNQSEWRGRSMTSWLDEAMSVLDA